MRWMTTFAMAAVLLTAAACGGGSSGGEAGSASGDAAAGASRTVEIRDFAYEPETITVAEGTTITWTNRDFFGHTVTSGTPDDQTEAFDGVLGEVAEAEGLTFSLTMDEPGSQPYFCRFHPTMLGEIIVEG